MDLEEMIKALAQGGINVEGDLVMEKKVEYEVNGVAAGGIGIQVVNDKENLGEKKKKEEEDKPSPVPHPTKRRSRKPLFQKADNAREENIEVRRRERDNLLKYLSLHNMGGRFLTTRQDDTLNSIVASFLVAWRDKNLIAKDFSGNAVHRFLHDECGIKTEVDEQSYANKITQWVKNKNYSIDILAEVETFMKNSIEA